ncbi:MAG: hypothetical protein KGV56_00190 [Gammaproteobacteria bacterium]|nr:hypothetical protein [Gammaproteobacteria bacterium]
MTSHNNDFLQSYLQRFYFDKHYIENQKAVNRYSLQEEAEKQISKNGREAKLTLYKKGSIGTGRHKQKSLFPKGPMGAIAFDYPNHNSVIQLDFKAVDVLRALNPQKCYYSDILREDAVFDPLQEYYRKQLPRQLPENKGMLACEMSGVSFTDDAISFIDGCLEGKNRESISYFITEIILFSERNFIKEISLPILKKFYNSSCFKNFVKRN